MAYFRVSIAKQGTLLAFLLVFLPFGGDVRPAAAQEPDRKADELIAEFGLRLSDGPIRDFEGWEKPKRMIVRVDQPSRITYFEEVVKGVDLIPATSVDEAMQYIDTADALIGFCDERLVAAAQQLKWIQIASSGSDKCLAVPGVTDGLVLMTSMKRTNSKQIAEHAMAMTLSLSRALNHFQAIQDQGTWGPARMPPTAMTEIGGKTMLIVGLGGIGTQIARRAKAFDMRVIATRNSSREGPDFVDYVGLADELDDLVPQADVVINAAPLTDATTGLFDADFFTAMKPEAYFITVGRGKSVVTEDLVAALKSGAIAGAGLDVTDPEPLPDGHPLWTTPNVIITPHVAGQSNRVFERFWPIVRENMRRYVEGDRVYSVVDLTQGY